MLPKYKQINYTNAINSVFIFISYSYIIIIIKLLLNYHHQKFTEIHQLIDLNFFIHTYIQDYATKINNQIETTEFKNKVKFREQLDMPMTIRHSQVYHRVTHLHVTIQNTTSNRIISYHNRAHLITKHGSSFSHTKLHHTPPHQFALHKLTSHYTTLQQTTPHDSTLKHTTASH